MQKNNANYVLLARFVVNCLLLENGREIIDVLRIHLRVSQRERNLAKQQTHVFISKFQKLLF